jgi:hypothetical protein
MIAYRIFENRNNLPYTLFHAINGTRTIPTDKWIQATIKAVTNPGGGRIFYSGFHVCKSKESVQEYLKRFKMNRDLIVCKVEVDKLRSKPGSRDKVFLANKMRVDSEDWNKAIKN